MAVWPFKRRTQPMPSSGLYIPAPNQAGGSLIAGMSRVGNDSALRHSAVWAAIRLRADLISTMGVGAYRVIDGQRVTVAIPSVQWRNGGQPCSWIDAMYATQVDLDRAGNAFGVITKRNGMGLPAEIELAAIDSVSVRSVDGKLTVMVSGTPYPYEDIWHERAYTVAGLLLGLSPVAYAAYSVGSYLSAQQFALDWFANSAMPAVSLRNKDRIVPAKVAEEIKGRYMASVQPGGVFVHGSDWELAPIKAVSQQAQYIELMQFGVPDIARFFGVPADLIESAVSGQSVTYANIGQRNLQFMTMNLGPAVARREDALSRMLPAPRRVCLDRSSVLAMDPQTLATVLQTLLASRQITPTEARAANGRPPFTVDDLAEIEAVYGPPRAAPAPAAQPGPSTGGTQQ